MLNVLEMMAMHHNIGIITLQPGVQCRNVKMTRKTWLGFGHRSGLRLAVGLETVGASLELSFSHSQFIPSLSNVTR